MTGKNLIESLLKVDVKDRLNVRQALDHPWFTEVQKKPQQKLQPKPETKPKPKPKTKFEKFKEKFGFFNKR